MTGAEYTSCGVPVGMTCGPKGAAATIVAFAVAPSTGGAHMKIPVDDSVRLAAVALRSVHVHDGQFDATSGVVDLPVFGDTLTVLVVTTGTAGAEPPWFHGRDLSHAIGGDDWHPSVCWPV